METAVSTVLGMFLLSTVTVNSSQPPLAAGPIQSECRDRYFWVRVASPGGPAHFEAVDGMGVHSLAGLGAAGCGYTISTFRMDGFTSLRASYFSCYTGNQNDELFTFNLIVTVTSADGRWSSQPVSRICSLPLSWSHRELTCEEGYMEVTVSRDIACDHGSSKQPRQAAITLAQKTASSAWQLMFLQNGQVVSTMSLSDAQRLGYSLRATPTRVVFRSPYRQPQSRLETVEGVPIEVIQASLFFRQNLLVILMDVSVACSINAGSFNGSRLVWDTPRVFSPLAGGSGAALDSKSIQVGVDSQLLDHSTAAARGITVEMHGGLVRVAVPFGAEGGYRRSLVVNNTYKETYVIFLFYEHISLLYDNNVTVETRHRLLRVVDAPLHCQKPFTVDQSDSKEDVFTVLLGNIPADVVLEGMNLNDWQVSVSDASGLGVSVRKEVNLNTSQSFTLRVPFGSRLVNTMLLDEGAVQYNLDVNYTLAIMPQRDIYHHHTSVVAQSHHAFPPELTAECSGRGVTFSIQMHPRADLLWEVGVAQDPLTEELASRRGYLLTNISRGIALQVPVFSAGYTYDNITLQDFYGAFKLNVRDSKTLALKISTSKRCLFKTEELIVCSSDGTMTVVTTPTMTWPTVEPIRTSLLDRSCGPKQTDQSRVLFEFSLDSCGTRMMVGDSVVVYENEILYDRQLLADGSALVSRDSKFKLTVRCFYPLGAIGRLFVDKIFRAKTSGLGSVQVLANAQGSDGTIPVLDCPLQPVPSRPRPGPSRYFTLTPAGRRLAQTGHPVGSLVPSNTPPSPLQPSWPLGVHGGPASPYHQRGSPHTYGEAELHPGRWGQEATFAGSNYGSLGRMEPERGHVPYGYGPAAPSLSLRTAHHDRTSPSDWQGDQAAVDSTTGQTLTKAGPGSRVLNIKVKPPRTLSSETSSDLSSHQHGPSQAASDTPRHPQTHGQSYGTASHRALGPVEDMFPHTYEGLRSRGGAAGETASQGSAGKAPRLFYKLPPRSHAARRHKALHSVVSTGPLDVLRPHPTGNRSYVVTVKHSLGFSPDLRETASRLGLVQSDWRPSNHPSLSKHHVMKATVNHKLYGGVVDTQASSDPQWTSSGSTVKGSDPLQESTGPRVRVRVSGCPDGEPGVHGTSLHHGILRGTKTSVYDWLMN